jgi:hypothetical protein
VTVQTKNRCNGAHLTGYAHGIYFGHFYPKGSVLSLGAGHHNGKSGNEIRGTVIIYTFIRSGFAAGTIFGVGNYKTGGHPLRHWQSWP